MSHFDDLSGQPGPTRRANWDGREEPLTGFLTFNDNRPNVHGPPVFDRQALEHRLRELGHEPDTIDIDHEVAD